MDIKELFKSSDIDTIIKELKLGRNSTEPDTDLYISQLDPSKHDIFDNAKRPDKTVKEDNPNPNENGNPISPGYVGGEKEQTKTVDVARIALAIQKLIVKRAVAFTFGNQVTLNSEPENKAEITVLNAVKKVLFNTKSRTINRKVAREIFSTTEAAELWYPVEKQANYGFASKFKLRVAIFSPKNGDKLYPYFDETGDMIAFSREFLITDKNGKKITYFETYTDTEHLMWKQSENKWEIVESYPKPITIGKIPIIYGKQDFVEWEDVQGLIDRLEILLSNFADTNDYHASPKITVRGEVLGFAAKGETGAILQLEGDNAEAKYLSWEHAPESVRLEIETLLRMIYTITQTPDISFDSVKGIGAVSGIALKLLFLDAHLKVLEKMEIFDDYLQRRLSVIQAYIAQFNTGLKAACESLTIEPEIVPYMIEDEQAKVKLLTEANGYKPVASQKATIEMLGWTNDNDAEYKQILQEKEAEAYNNAIEKTV
ncbi:MAG: phage portal protein [Prevotellaceae bacterium]|jgi:SPP1 family phage portal protein|nr:phage portal protein [Prevotellaceae bacterium]